MSKPREPITSPFPVGLIGLLIEGVAIVALVPDGGRVPPIALAFMVAGIFFGLGMGRP